MFFLQLLPCKHFSCHQARLAVQWYPCSARKLLVLQHMWVFGGCFAFLSHPSRWAVWPGCGSAVLYPGVDCFGSLLSLGWCPSVVHLSEASAACDGRQFCVVLGSLLTHHEVFFAISWNVSASHWVYIWPLLSEAWGRGNWKLLQRKLGLVLVCQTYCASLPFFPVVRHLCRAE